MTRQTVTSPDAPKAMGPYSHAVVAGGLLFASGQLPLDPTSGKLVAGDIKAQVRQALTNLAAVVRAAGLDLADAVKVTVYLADLADFKAMNEVYGEFFKTDPPARVTIGAAVPGGAAVEIDLVAALRK